MAENREIRRAKKFPWTKDEDSLLGKMKDRELARQLNRTIPSVRDRRRFLGIAPFEGRPQPERIPHRLRGEHARLFSGNSDREIQIILGWNIKRIRRHRRHLIAQTSDKGKRWTVEEDKLLGTKPDRMLAKMWGRSVETVRSRRWQKRIRVKRDWTAEELRMLGTQPDYVIAKMFRHSVTNVHWHRKKLGIPAFGKPKSWTKEEEDLLGIKSDKELAKEFGRTLGAVVARRNILGRRNPDAHFRVIKTVKVNQPKESKRKPPYCTWLPEEDALLGTMPDHELAKKLGCSVQRVQRRRTYLDRPYLNAMNRRWTPKEIALLGTKPDREVGKLVRRSLGNVRYKRLEQGIPFQNPNYVSWKAEDIALLGKVSDEELARKTGRTAKAVALARFKRGIPWMKPVK